MASQSLNEKLSPGVPFSKQPWQ